MFKYRRVLAFLLDILFVSIIVMLLANNPKINKYYYDSEQYTKALQEKESNLKISYSTDDPNEMINNMYDQIGVEMYDAYKSSVYTFIIFLIVNTLYFTIFVYCNNGKTLGCALFKLQIKKKNNQTVGVLNLGMRSLFMGSTLITYSPIACIFMIVVPRLLDSRQAFMPMVYGTTVVLIFEIALLVVFLTSKKNMTIQDYLSNTKVLDLKK